MASKLTAELLASGDISELQRMLAEGEGVDVNAPVEFNQEPRRQAQPPLVHAFEAGRVDLMRLLLERGAKADIVVAETVRNPCISAC